MKLGAKLRNRTSNPGGNGSEVYHSATEGFFGMVLMIRSGGVESVEKRRELSRFSTGERFFTKPAKKRVPHRPPMTR